MTDKTTLINFPCDFTLKIIGVTSDSFVSDITAIVIKHYPETKLCNIVPKNSGQGNYTAITAIVHAHDKPSLDALYTELTQYPGIKMVL
ncbi:MAG: DUF493 domain-containing protein [Legionella sp.]|nr:DUF493 domain-containing protein [Legionella sp.]